MSTTWTNGTKEHACHAFPPAIAALVGCVGRGTMWRYDVGHFGKRVPEFACPACAAARVEFDALRGAPARAAWIASKGAP